MASDRGTTRRTTGSPSGSRGRGFASMDDEQQRQIARKGGQASARAQVRDAQGQFAGSRATRSGGQGQGQGKSSANRGGPSNRAQDGTNR